MRRFVRSAISLTLVLTIASPLFAQSAAVHLSDKKIVEYANSLIPKIQLETWRRFQKPPELRVVSSEEMGDLMFFDGAGLLLRHALPELAKRTEAGFTERLPDEYKAAQRQLGSIQIATAIQEMGRDALHDAMMRGDHRAIFDAARKSLSSHLQYSMLNGLVTESAAHTPAKHLTGLRVVLLNRDQLRSLADAFEDGTEAQTDAVKYAIGLSLVAAMQDDAMDIRDLHSKAQTRAELRRSNAMLTAHAVLVMETMSARGDLSIRKEDIEKLSSPLCAKLIVQVDTDSYGFLQEFREANGDHKIWDALRSPPSLRADFEKPEAYDPNNPLPTLEQVIKTSGDKAFGPSGRVVLSKTRAAAELAKGVPTDLATDASLSAENAIEDRFVMFVTPHGSSYICTMTLYTDDEYASAGFRALHAKSETDALKMTRYPGASVVKDSTQKDFIPRTDASVRRRLLLDGTPNLEVSAIVLRTGPLVTTCIATEVRGTERKAKDFIEMLIDASAVFTSRDTANSSTEQE